MDVRTNTHRKTSARRSHVEKGHAGYHDYPRQQRAPRGVRCGECGLACVGLLYLASPCDGTLFGRSPRPRDFLDPAPPAAQAGRATGAASSKSAPMSNFVNERWYA